MGKKACVRALQKDRLFICIQNHEDNLFYCTYDCDLGTKAQNLNFDSQISSMKWLNDSKLILQHDKKVEIFDVILNQVVFSHEASKKAMEIMDFAIHPIYQTLFVAVMMPNQFRYLII